MGFLKRVFRGLTLTSMLAISGTASVVSNDKFIILQSTTSTQNSGLFDYILPVFTKKTGIEVRVVAVGTGQALRNGRNGDGDVLLVHAKPAEEKFVFEGFGVKRRDVMFNDFVIVGPAADPAKVGGVKNAPAALGMIADAKTPFASRGDDSGTHKTEKRLWKVAYTLTDRATWISFKNKGDFKIHVEGDAALFNQYGVILVSPVKHPAVKKDLGQNFIDWITGKEGQKTINSYTLKGQQLFFANAN